MRLCRNGLHEMTEPNTVRKLETEGYEIEACRACRNDRWRRWKAERYAEGDESKRKPRKQIPWEQLCEPGALMVVGEQPDGAPLVGFVLPDREGDS